MIEVIDADPEARQRTVKVKVAAQYQPVLPDAPAGSPFVPVEFEGLQATPYVDASGCRAKETGTSTSPASSPPRRGRTRWQSSAGTRGLPPLPEAPVPYTLTVKAEAVLDASAERADLVPLPGGREVTA